jgi:ubiquitin-conjugating enzyme E2 C
MSTLSVAGIGTEEMTNDTNRHSHSASPLNGEAAELWDKDMAEFKKKVLGRHRDIEEE